MNINININNFRETLPQGCKLIAVSKMQSPETILQAYQAGQRIFGENKTQELVPKYETLPKDIEWHMIGHLQSNKVKYIAHFVHLIHSIDSLKLLQEVNKQGAKANRIIPCLLQVHIAEEETKFGFSENEVLDLINQKAVEGFANIKITGLMGMATFTDNKEQVRKEFKSLRHLFEKIKQMELPPQIAMQELSMGMSNDYKIAIEEGSTMIRVGTAIFGSR